MNADACEIWSCGGGTQSAAIAALIVQGILPKPDLAIIVDTERERETTWAYYDAVLAPELCRVGVQLHRVKTSEFSDSSLYAGAEDDTLLIPAFYKDSAGNIGKMRGFCSGTWKRDTVRRWARANGVKHGRLWLGISADEPRRIRADSGVSWLSPWYPLGPTELRYTRGMCISAVKNLGWPAPPRSSCWMCPNAGDQEWRRLKVEAPEDWEKACVVDEEIRSREPGVYLHRSGVPLRDVDLTDSQMSFGDMCAGMCFV